MLLALREQVYSLDAKIVDLVKLREAESYLDETFREVIDVSSGLANKDTGEIFPS